VALAYYLFVPPNAIHIKILNYITNDPTRFGASSPSSRSFDIAFAKLYNITSIEIP
jgi:hypothetical protein